MRKYVHWLKISGYCNLESTAKQFEAIENYIKTHPDASALMYQYNTGSYNWLVRLNCRQSYSELELDVNSSSTELQRLSGKPNNIGRERIFKFPEHYRKYISKT